MDSLTHTVIGACLGEAIAGKRLGKKAMLVGALVNNLPDIDVTTSLWTEPAKELLVHRGITHSILFAVIATPLLAFAFQKLFKKQELSFTRWLVLIGSGLFLHILMDAFTTYGTGWFEPFSHYRVTFNTLFIIDPFLMIPMLAGAVILLIMKRSAYPGRSRVAFAALSLSLLYLLITICIKLYVNGVIEKDLLSKKISHQEFMATPTPMNNLLWYSAVKSGNDFYIGYYSVLDKNPTLYWEFFEKQDSLLAPIKAKDDVKILQQFSKNYYCIRKQDSVLNFSDMRFGQLGGWNEPQAPFVFNFDLQLKHNGSLNLQQGRFKSVSAKELGYLVDRIKGVEN
jgi:inner membrane protein